MQRVHVLAQQLCAAQGAAPAGTAERARRLKEVTVQYFQGVQSLKENGVSPPLTSWEVVVAQRRNQTHENASRPRLAKAVEAGEQKGSFAVAGLLPGPLKDAKTREEKIDIVDQTTLAIVRGYNHQLFATWQQNYGDQGLSSNIVVPDMGRFFGDQCNCRVLVAHPDDAERLARMHPRKDGSFEPTLFDSIISTTDNDHWQAQRRHLAEVFLPLSSLAKVLPVSLARAKQCAARLGGAAAAMEPVDMSDFLLHEAQAQLQLALLGLDEAFMERTNADIRKNFMMHPEAPVGSLSEAMAEVMRRCEEDPSLSLPSDNRPVHGPLSRALQQSTFPASTDYGNALLILFAGHDTTGHTMTWLLFELARHPEHQRELQREVDGFFGRLGGREIEYKDLAGLDFLDRCITETLRLWNAVPNGTFRQLQFDDEVRGAGGQMVALPKGTHVNIMTWPRHRNPDLWGPDAHEFNPRREFLPQEVMRVGSGLAAANPQSRRFSPFTHNPRSCLGRNFAQMEMRLILLSLLREYTFALAPPYDALQGKTFGATAGDPEEFRGVNTGTMGPMNLHEQVAAPFGGKFYTTGMKLFVHKRSAL